ncbi:hypothetical protein [Actinobacillus succinogenes]|nr:hypothetical protein [Actinobacillus succinogenes]
MKKTPLAILCSVLVASSFLTACEKLATAKPYSQQPAQQAPSQQQGNVLPLTAPETPIEDDLPAQDPLLTAFNQSVKIVATARTIARDKSKGTGSLVTYQINNTSAKPIQSVKWTTAFTSGNTILFDENIVADFSKEPLSAQQDKSIQVMDYFKSMSKEAQTALRDPKKQINVIIVAREISFSDGSKIIVSVTEDDTPAKQ